MTDEDVTAASRGPRQSATPVKTVRENQSIQIHLTPTKQVDLPSKTMPKDKTGADVISVNKDGGIVSPKNAASDKNEDDAQENKDIVDDEGKDGGVVSPKNTSGVAIPVPTTKSDIVDPRDQTSPGVPLLLQLISLPLMLLPVTLLRPRIKHLVLLVISFKHLLRLYNRICLVHPRKWISM